MDISIERHRHNGGFTLRTLVVDPKNPEIGPYFHKKTYFNDSVKDAKADFRREIKEQKLKPTD